MEQNANLTWLFKIKRRYQRTLSHSGVCSRLQADRGGHHTGLDPLACGFGGGCPEQHCSCVLWLKTAHREPLPASSVCQQSFLTRLLPGQTGLGTTANIQQEHISHQSWKSYSSPWIRGMGEWCNFSGFAPGLDLEILNSPGRTCSFQMSLF